MMLNERGHAIIATAGTARRSTTGRSGPTVSAPISAEGGWLSADVVRDQHQSVVGAFGVFGEDVVGERLRLEPPQRGGKSASPPRRAGAVAGALGCWGGGGVGAPRGREPRQRVGKCALHAVGHEDEHFCRLAAV